MEKLTEKDVDNLFMNIELKFSIYYKYKFTFKAEREGYIIKASFGGIPNEIYKTTIQNNELRELGCVKHYAHQWSYVSIYKDGNLVFKWEE